MSLDPLETEEDVRFVKDLIAEFQDKTGSLVAKDILDNWESARAKFVKVDRRNIFKSCFRKIYSAF